MPYTIYYVTTCNKRCRINPCTSSVLWSQQRKGHLMYTPWTGWGVSRDGYISKSHPGQVFFFSLKRKRCPGCSWLFLPSLAFPPRYLVVETCTLEGLGCEQRGRWAIISWYEHSSLSVHWMTPSSASTRPYVLLEKQTHKQTLHCT